MDSRRASWWHNDGDRIQCELCPHRCRITNGASGLCGVRVNEGGELIAASYGKVCVRDFDPIEKKPIFHFQPGTKVRSFGTFGCNLDCDGCQNHDLARATSGGSFVSPGEAVDEALGLGADGVAFTFNEPTTWYEYVLDTSMEAKRRSLYTMMNTNGYIMREPAAELFRHVDVLNIDVKSFDNRTYKSICGGDLQPVLDTCLLAKEMGVHVELTYLLIPGVNDSMEEVSAFARWAADSMGTDIPVFLFRFRPSYRLSHLPEQSMERMHEAADVASRNGLEYVYLGGVAESVGNTLCPACSAVVVERAGTESAKVCFKGCQVSRFCPTVSEVKVNLKDGKCPRCGHPISVRT